MKKIPPCHPGRPLLFLRPLRHNQRATKEEICHEQNQRPESRSWKRHKRGSTQSCSGRGDGWHRRSANGIPAARFWRGRWRSTGWSAGGVGAALQGRYGSLSGPGPRSGAVWAAPTRDQRGEDGRITERRSGPQQLSVRCELASVRKPAVPLAGGPRLFLFRPGAGSIQPAGWSQEGIESRQNSKIIDIISIIGIMSQRREDDGATTDHGPGAERNPRVCV